MIRAVSHMREADSALSNRLPQKGAHSGGSGSESKNASQKLGTRGFRQNCTVELNALTSRGKVQRLEETRSPTEKYCPALLS